MDRPVCTAEYGCWIHTHMLTGHWAQSYINILISSHKPRVVAFSDIVTAEPGQHNSNIPHMVTCICSASFCGQNDAADDALYLENMTWWHDWVSISGEQFFSVFLCFPISSYLVSGLAYLINIVNALKIIKCVSHTHTKKHCPIKMS